MPEMLTAAQVAALLKISTRTLWKWVACGAWPQPVRFNRKVVRWKRDAVEEAMEAVRPVRVAP